MPYASKDRYNAYRRAWRRHRHRTRRALAYKRLPPLCALCHDPDAWPLQLHHADKSLKTFDYSQMADVPLPRFIAELAYTILLCKRCHDALHTDNLPNVPTHGPSLTDADWYDFTHKQT